MVFVFLVLLVASAVALLYRGKPYLSWVVPGAVGLLVWLITGPALPVLFFLAALVYLGLAVVFGVPSIRQQAITARVMEIMSRILPRISATERAALEAGTIWWDGDLFSGNPDWNKLAKFDIQRLSREEKDFLEGPVEELCRMIDDHAAHFEGDLAPEVWQFMKDNLFFGMIIPKQYGGLGFSAIGHSAVVLKVSSASTAAGVTVMVPNSLGPAELLLRYGTQEQKDVYLPRLARGDEIPAFALTEPLAGSDAASQHSRGVVCRSTFDGKEVLGMRLTWDKRYATLAPVATVLGLAFKLEDPDHLLGEEEDIGITCALVPTDLEGVETGRRHDPLGIPFMNGPTTGHDVFVPLDYIIGGEDMAGQGWRMLMDSLAAGRSISLPALAAGATQMSTRVAGAYATIREQFGLPIGRFEGIQERLGRIGSLAYLVDATRVMTAGAVDAGEKPSVVSAIVKAYSTEIMRQVVNDTMDVIAGAGISKGPRNTMAHAYTSLPIGITVEGANILTRCLIIFGQGAIRCHPWVLEEIHAVEEKNLNRFDHAFWKHMGFTATNVTRAWVLGITGCRISRPAVGGPMQQYFAQFSRMSAAFTFMADVSMAVLGGTLKRKEMISARMADALAWMYLGSATLKRYVDEGHPDKDAPFVKWSALYSLYQVQEALLGVLDNFPIRWVWPLRFVLFPFGADLRPPSDRRTMRAARMLIEGREGRERIARSIYVPADASPGLGALEHTLEKVVAAIPAEKLLRGAVTEGRLKKAPRLELAQAGLEEGVITREQYEQIVDAHEARVDAVQVDAFSAEYFRRGVRLQEVVQTVDPPEGGAKAQA